MAFKYDIKWPIIKYILTFPLEYYTGEEINLKYKLEYKHNYGAIQVGNLGSLCLDKAATNVASLFQQQ